MYAYKDPFPYAYALIPVLTPNLLFKYVFYNCYLFKLKNLFGDKLNWQWKCIIGEGRQGVVRRLQAWKYIMLLHLGLLIEYSTEVSEEFQNFITF